MTNETIDWQKQQAQKLFNFIQKNLDFDDIIVKLPLNHQLNQVSNVTVKKLIGYIINKLEGQQGKFDKDIIIQGYIDDNDIAALLNTFYQIISLTETQIKKDLNLFYRYLSEVIVQYEEEFKTLAILQNQLEQLKKDFKNQELLVNKVKDTEDEIQHKVEKTKKRVNELIGEIERIWEIQKEVKEKSLLPQK